MRSLIDILELSTQEIDELIEKAQDMADHFLATGEWKREVSSCW